MTLSLALNAESDTFILVGSRVSGLVLTAPMFSARAIPTLVTTAVILVLSIVLTPLVPLVHTNFLLLGGGVVLQFAIGALMGSILAMFLSAFTIAGQIVTYQLGIGLASFSNPALIGASSMLSEWEGLLALFIFVALQGPELLVMALRDSFTALPLTHVGIPPDALAFVVGLFGTVLEIALLVAAPLVVVGLVADLSVGILGRAFPQVSAFFLSLPVKLGLALLVLLASLPLFFALVPNALTQGFTDLSRLLVLLEGRP
jgi:flagellar biosynthetic protein FliR